MPDRDLAQAARDIDRALDLVHAAQGAIPKDALSSLNVSPYMELAEALLPLHRAVHAVKELAAGESLACAERSGR